LLPEVIDLLCIPVLMNEVPLKGVSDDEAAKIASRVRRTIPVLSGVKVVIIPVLYYLTDILSRMTLDEITVNSASMIELMERKGLSSEIYVFNPYSSNGIIPVPSRFGGSAGGVNWAIIPIVVLGNNYIDPAAYELDDEDLDIALDDLENVLSEIYGASMLKVFPPTLIEDLMDLIDSVEVYQGNDLETSAG
jgi:hypothetical protein